jgi:hypothetical protein
MKGQANRRALYLADEAAISIAIIAALSDILMKSCAV